MNAMTLTLNNFVHGIIKSDASLPRGIWMARLVVGFESYESGWIKVLSRLGQQKMIKNIIQKSAAKNGPLCFVLLFIFWSFTSFYERFEHLKKGGKHEGGFSGLLYQWILENEIGRYSIRPMQSSKSCSGGVFRLRSKPYHRCWECVGDDKPKPVGGFNYLLFSPLLGEMIQFDYCTIFIKGWNHQLENIML